MTPQAFIAKWQNSQLKERAAAQEHFLDICRMLDEPTPAEVDPTGKDYGFEVGASKTTGGNGFADVFKRGHFGWEYKGTKANLDTAFAQLQRYAIALDNPPLLIVSDIGTTIRIHTNWTNSVSKVYEIAIADLGDPEKRRWLKAALSDPDALRPSKTRQELTEEVAGEFAQLARSLRERGHDPEQVAHFINRMVFCMFAEDVKLLPGNMFTMMLERATEHPEEFEGFARDLFSAMQTGGRIGFERVAWFNGGLFDDDLVFPLTKPEIALVLRAARQYWGDIDPSILGTLFERGLDPDKRSQLGAHYTDREKIMMIVNPVIIEPLSAEWEKAREEIATLMDKAATAKGAAKTRATRQAQATLDRHLKRLADFRVLDPACGSGNFLYLALRALKDLEHKAQVEAEALGLPRGFPRIGPEVVKGIELNPYAAELARVSVWIGEIQWMLFNGFAASQNPILKPLETIECRDALMTWQPGESEGEEGQWIEAEWPKADAIIGNPPFVGDKKMIRELGERYTHGLRSLYRSVLPRSGDLVCFWFAKALASLAAGDTERVGLVATNSIRAGASNDILKQISETGSIFSAWSDEPWVVEGAAVRVSIISFSREQDGSPIMLNGSAVTAISSDLAARSTDVTGRQKLDENMRVCFVGVILNGDFELPDDEARRLLRLPLNVNGRPNSDVIRPTLNGDDFNGERLPKWVVDFGTEMGEEAAAQYEVPFQHVLEKVKPFRQRKKDNGEFAVRAVGERQKWWRHARSRPAMRQALQPLARYIATPMVSSYRTFGFLQASVLPDQKLVVFAREDATFLGVLESRHHLVWTKATCSWIGAGNDVTYSNTSVFETFPFPDGLTPNTPAEQYADDPRATAIAEAASRLNELRENWLNPADLVRREPEVVPGYPDRIIPISEEAEKVLKKRTLTNLYNERPAWLQHAHKALDDAVAAAYGWPTELDDDEVLARLFALNQERAAKG